MLFNVILINANELEEYGIIDESLNELEQNDPKLIEIVKSLLIPPSKKPYNFTEKANLNFKGQYGQPVEVDKILGHRLKKGFFVEAGAYDGEKISNSLYFELRHLWTGVLIEPNPDYFEQLKSKNRKAWLFGHCLSTKTTPEIVHFDAAGLIGGIINQDGNKKPADIDEESLLIMHPEQTIEEIRTAHNYKRRTIKTQCFPLYTVLKALENPTVHYLTLDIEGAELPVLKTVDWSDVDIKILDIEMNHVGEIFKGSQKNVDKLLTKNGYDFYEAVQIDHIYVKRDFNIHKDL